MHDASFQRGCFLTRHHHLWIAEQNRSLPAMLEMTFGSWPAVSRATTTPEHFATDQDFLASLMPVRLRGPLSVMAGHRPAGQKKLSGAAKSDHTLSTPPTLSKWTRMIIEAQWMTGKSHWMQQCTHTHSNQRKVTVWVTSTCWRFSVKNAFSVFWTYLPIALFSCRDFSPQYVIWYEKFIFEKLKFS